MASNRTTDEESVDSNASQPGSDAPKGVTVTATERVGLRGIKGWFFVGDGPPNKKRSCLARLSRGGWIVILITITMVLAGLIIGLVLGLTHHAAAQLGPVLALENGTITALNDNNNVEKYLGIRYAKPPTQKALRFAAPQPLDSGTSLQLSDNKLGFGPACIASPSTNIPSGQSEDCLYLNVFAPSDKSKKHPVFVFIQGGGFNGLSNPNQDGTHIVNGGASDIVVVTMNYRVGLWGFLASKEVKANGNLNVGLLDQRLALHWIKDNIEKFGGDPSHITLGGASAGAASVNLHLMAYGGRDDGLFHAAAGESNSFGAQKTIEESQYQYDHIVKQAGCDSASDTLDCLRGKSPSDLAKVNSIVPTPGGAGKNPVFMYSNVIEGQGGFTQDYTYKQLAAGKFLKVPTIFGGDTNEGTDFTPHDLDNVDDMRGFLKDNWTKLSDANLTEIQNHYVQNDTTPPQYPNKGDYWFVSSVAYGEMRYNCPGISLSKAWATHGVPQTWQYHWDVLSDANKANGMGVTHTAEASSIWGTSTGVDQGQISYIQAYWASFIRSYDPSTHKKAGSPDWTRYNDSSAQRMHFVNDPTKNAMEAVSQGQKDWCAWLADLGPQIEQ